MNQLVIRNNPQIPERREINLSLSSVGCNLKEKISSDFQFVGYEGVNKLTEHQLHALRQSVEEHMAPADDDEVYKALIKVKLLTASRKQSDSEMEMQLRTYANELRRYPADATLKALDKIADDHEFFPSWREIMLRVEYHCRRRQTLIGEIDRALNRKRQAQIRAAS